METNKHHILHDRRSHNLDQHNRYLRNQMGMIATMDIYAHRELHKECSPVPPLSLPIASQVRGSMLRDTDPLQAMENYMFAVERALFLPRLKPIEKELARVTIHAVELQRPYVRSGIVGEW
jgi:hypothetical protein